MDKTESIWFWLYNHGYGSSFLQHMQTHTSFTHTYVGLGNLMDLHPSFLPI